MIVQSILHQLVPDLWHESDTEGGTHFPPFLCPYIQDYAFFILKKVL